MRLKRRRYQNQARVTPTLASPTCDRDTLARDAPPRDVTPASERRGNDPAKIAHPSFQVVEQPELLTLALQSQSLMNFEALLRILGRKNGI